MTKPHYSVLIATPGKMIHAEYVECLVETCDWLSKNGLTYKFIGKQSSFIPSGRELTALDSYESDWVTREVGAGKYTYNKIFWIDSDMSWDVEDFKRIYFSDLPIVAGLYATHPNGTVACSKFDPEGRPALVHESEFFMQEQPVEMFGVGFGFVAMKHGVFEACDRPWFRIEGVRWDGLEFDTNIGEDYSWCMNARRNGYKTFIDPLVKVKHHKETIYELP
jgi:hypothetical protein